jgi:hypothetical protein
MSVKEIEQAITQLPKRELTELVIWLEQYHHQVWDKQIENDLDSGRLDTLLSEVESESKERKLSLPARNLQTRQEARRKLEDLASGTRAGLPSIPDEALSSESIYAGRGE